MGSCISRPSGGLNDDGNPLAGSSEGSGNDEVEAFQELSKGGRIRSAGNAGSSPAISGKRHVVASQSRRDFINTDVRDADLGLENDDLEGIHLEASSLADEPDDPNTVIQLAPNGTLTRATIQLPGTLLCAARKIVNLFRLQEKAYYGDENGRRFVRRCCLVQDVVLAHPKLQASTAFMCQLEEILDEACELLLQYSKRGWLVRLLQQPDDHAEIMRLDRSLVEALSSQDVNFTTHPQLLCVPKYSVKFQALASKLEELGGLDGLRSKNMQAAGELRLLLHSKQSSLVDVLEEELADYENASGIGPFTSIRHQELQTAWRKSFPNKELVTWNDFWRSFPQNLSSAVDPAVTDILRNRTKRENLQQLLDRMTPEMVDVVELDFLFPPTIPLAAQLKGLLSTRTSYMSSVTPQKLVHTRLFHFPEEPAELLGRDMPLAQVMISLQDMTNKMVVIVGSPGTGRSALAAAVGKKLVLQGQWSEAFWVDLNGVKSVAVAGSQIMAALGLCSETGDIQLLLSWLEARSASSGNSMMGLLLTGLDDLLCNTQAQDELNTLLESMLKACKKLRVVMTSPDKLLTLQQHLLTFDLGNLTADQALDIAAEELPAATKEVQTSLVAACGSMPIALHVVCNVIKHSSSADGAAAFLRTYADPQLPFKAHEVRLPCMVGPVQELMLKAIMTAILMLPEELSTALFALSIIPGGFSRAAASELLGATGSSIHRQGLLQKLARRGLLRYHKHQQLYCMHGVTKAVATALCKGLQLKLVAARWKLVENVVQNVGQAWQMHQIGCHLSAQHLWSRDERAIAQTLEWASDRNHQHQELVPLLITMLWDSLPMLTMHFSWPALKDFCEDCVAMARASSDPVGLAQAQAQLARLQAEQGEAKGAEGLLREALEALEGALGKDHAVVGRCYQTWGLAALRGNKFVDARKHLEQALRLQEDALGINHPEVVETLSMLAEAMKRIGQSGAAEDLYRRALAVQRELLGPDHPDLATTMTNLALLLRSCKRMEEADQLYRQSYDIVLSELGPEHPRVATALIQLGNMANLLGKLHQAEQHFRRALGIRQKALGQTHADTAAAYTHLSMHLRNEGKPSAALPLAQRALDIQAAALGASHPEVAFARQHLAELMLDLGRYEEAERECVRSIDIIKAAISPKSPRLVGAYNLLALIVRLMGKPAEAEATCRRGLALGEERMGPDHPNVASCLNCLAEVLRDLTRYKEGEEACRRGLGIRERELGKEHLAVALSLNTLATLQRCQGRLADAEKTILRCINMRSKLQGQDNPQLGSCHSTLAHILMDGKKLPEAEEAARKALTIRDRTLGKDHPDVAQSYSLLCEVLLAAPNGNLGEVSRMLGLALGIYAAKLPSEHLQCVKARGMQDECHRRMGRPVEQLGFGYT